MERFGDKLSYTAIALSVLMIMMTCNKEKPAPECVSTPSGLVTTGPHSIWTTDNTIVFQQNEDSKCMSKYIRDFPGDILLGEDMISGYKACGEEVPDRYLGPKEFQLKVPIKPEVF